MGRDPFYSAPFLRQLRLESKVGQSDRAVDGTRLHDNPDLDSSDPLIQIASFASHMFQTAVQLGQAHDLGVTPGRLEPWTHDFWSEGLQIFLKTVPAAQVRCAPLTMACCADMMASHEVVDGPGTAWSLLHEAAVALADVFADKLGGPTGRESRRVGLGIGPAAPGVVLFDEVAAIATAAGVARLRSAGEEVRFYCLRSAAGVSTLEIEWIRALARCERALDVALRHGYSERDFYRSLDRLWERLGVAGRSQALVLAARMGWLDNLGGDIQLS